MAQSLEPIGIASAEAFGTASIQHHYIASGGIAIGGDADVMLALYVTSSGGVLVYTHFQHTSSGGLLITENLFNKTEVRSIFEFIVEFTWEVRSRVEVLQSFEWGVGVNELSFFRVEGECIDANCETATFEGNDDKCGTPPPDGQRFIQTVVAKSVAEVCEKLKESRFSYPLIWPIKTIKRYSRPANLNVINQQIESQQIAGSGFDHECLELIEESFCEVPECLEFCLSEQVQVYTGVSVFLMSVTDHVTSGGVAIAGSASASFDDGSERYAEGEDGFTVGGVADVTFDAWEYVACGPDTCISTLAVAGSADVTCSSFSYESSSQLGRLFEGDLMILGAILEVGGAVSLSSFSYHYESDGELLLDGAAEVQVSLRYPEPGTTSWSLVSVSGSSDVVGSAFAFDYDSAGGLIIGGAADVNPGGPFTHYEYQATGGISTSAEAGIASVAWSYFASGGFVLSGEIELGRAYVVDGGLVMSGGVGASVQTRLSYTASGGIVVGGSSDIAAISGMWYYTMSGGFVIAGLATRRYSMDWLPAINLGMKVELTEIESIFPGFIGEDTLTIDETTVVANCGCDPLPLTLNFGHNFSDGNKLVNFLVRNRYSLPTDTVLRYSSTDNSWRNVFHFKGLGEDGSSQERWTLLFDWSCASEVGGKNLATTVWKFSTLIRRKNLTTQEDFDTRLLYTFPTDPACSNEKLDFSFVVDTQTKIATPTVSSVVESEIFYDDIGLFKSPYWISRPKLSIFISEGGIPGDVRRLNIEPIFPDRGVVFEKI